MVTRDIRLTDFTTIGEPPHDSPVQLLCEDHVGTYLIPFPCEWTDGTWRNQATGEIITGTVIGWRAFERNHRRKAPRFCS